MGTGGWSALSNLLYSVRLTLGRSNLSPTRPSLPRLRSGRVAVTDTVLIITYPMIIVVPICLLRLYDLEHVRIGILLSLDLFMKFTAAVGPNTMARSTKSGYISDSISKLALFCSIFVNSQLSRPHREPANRAWYSITLTTIKHKK